MLRVMKQKVKDDSDDVVSLAHTLELFPKEEDAAISHVVSHIPRTVSVESTMPPISSNSSLSSEGYHAMGPITRISDDETISIGFRSPSEKARRDSCRESSLHTTKTLDKRKMQDETKKRFSRQVSDLDLEESEAEKDDASKLSSASPRKKRRTLDQAPAPPTQHPVQLLAMPEDSLALNPLHRFVREQIEVFMATPADMAQPAPGRKNPVRLGQVGLRCIHCRNLPSRDRIKRAVCYPSSVGRVYHSVSDMKFDHFSGCRGLPVPLRAKFDTLKSQCKRRGDRRSGMTSSSTAQYYHDSALRMGMEDRGGGIFMAGRVTYCGVRPERDIVQSCSTAVVPIAVDSSSRIPSALAATYHPQMVATYQQAIQSLPPLAPSQPQQIPVAVTNPPETKKYTTCHPRGTMLLASSMDPQYLNPLHCFVRRNVEVFVATQDDIAAPSPGRKNKVTIGQVGIRCVHCTLLPIKDRVKRAVCYPPSVCSIYHSVSNMKFDHFGSCRGLPEEARKEFNNLRASCNRRGGSTSNGSRGMSNSTAQYYHDSALRMKLMDTEKGIRFAEQPEKKEEGGSSSDSVLDGISALMIAATNPTIRADR